MQRASNQHNQLVSVKKELALVRFQREEAESTLKQTANDLKDKSDQVDDLTTLKHKVDVQQAEISQLKSDIVGLRGENVTWRLAAEKAEIQVKVATSALEVATTAEQNIRYHKQQNASDPTTNSAIILNKNTNNLEADDSPQLSEIGSDIDLDFDLDIDLGTDHFDLEKPLSDLDME